VRHFALESSVLTSDVVIFMQRDDVEVMFFETGE
jgi:hypothetical protein